MKSGNNLLKNITVCKYGIYDTIMELSNKFHFDEFLFSKNKTIVFITFCIGIILFNNPTSIVYDHTNQKYIRGVHIVVLLWSNGCIINPACFRIWISKQKREDYHIKVELAMDMIIFAHSAVYK